MPRTSSPTGRIIDDKGPAMQNVPHTRRRPHPSEYETSSETFTMKGEGETYQSIPRRQAQAVNFAAQSQAAHLEMQALRRRVLVQGVELQGFEAFNIEGTMTGRFDSTTQQEVNRPRRTTTPPADPIPAPRRTKECTACHWVCPCGGTVPNVPTWCRHGVKRGIGSEQCADIAICVNVCKQYCDAYHDFRDAIKARKAADHAASVEKATNVQS